MSCLLILGIYSDCFLYIMIINVGGSLTVKLQIKSNQSFLYLPIEAFQDQLQIKKYILL